MSAGARRHMPRNEPEELAGYKHLVSSYVAPPLEVAFLRTLIGALTLGAMIHLLLVPLIGAFLS